MRLTPQEVEAIKDCARAHFGEGAVVRLFGSRVRDDLVGGDIDLHVVAESDERATYSQGSRFKEALEGLIGEQRIDVIVKKPHAEYDPIDQVAALTGIVLERGRDDLWRTPTLTLEQARTMMLADALAAGRQVAGRLQRSLDELGPHFPFTADSLADLDSLGAVRVDAMLMQFINLVSSVRDQLVRSVVAANGFEPESMTPRDLGNAAEKAGAIPPGFDWKKIVDARNSLAHQYLHDPVRQASLVNQVAAAAALLLEAFRSIESHIRREHPEAIRD